MARAYKYMCSDPGQELIKEDIRANGLDRVVVASCSPTLHEATFRRATAEGGINPYFFQMVNIREQDSWVHTDTRRGDRARPRTSSARPSTGSGSTSRWSGRGSRSTRRSWWWAAASPASTPR